MADVESFHLPIFILYTNIPLVFEKLFRVKNTKMVKSKIVVLVPNLSEYNS